ncbi:MAG TPA: DUF418 domain-containing protein [Bacteroidales bacterium]|nr:DUF418 domain-containing protein [Bacteroidales bacterium]HQQ11780.1 DUF418 domain-containing protein [Bacteroidales bacterium]
MQTGSNKRLHLVDALRGFAIVSIMLLHNIEHFDFYYTPESLPAWIVVVDKWIWDVLFFLFSGKSYAIFALLFGFTFYIQMSRQQQRGAVFGSRFAWRLFLLLLFGIVNTAFYQGDILTQYAVIGLVLIPFRKVNNRVLIWSAAFLLFQPTEWLRFFISSTQADVNPGDPASWAYFGQMHTYITGSSFIDTVVGNLSNGKTAVVLWTWENGRVLQTAGLFLLGFYLGRKEYFNDYQSSRKFWWQVLIVSLLAFAPLYFLNKSLDTVVDREVLRRPLQTIFGSWTNLAFLGILLSGFVLLYSQKSFKLLANHLSPIGRMSLSNYILQSIMGSIIYYGFGLGLYRYTGATYSLLIGIALAVLQGLFSKWWMKHHAQGPLETLWHKATWIKI